VILDGQNPAALEQAAARLAAGGLVAFPTETVYGLGADASSDTAVAGIFAAKGRPSDHPLIVHVADLAMAETFAVFDSRARALAAAFWPGPLTLVLPLRPDTGLSPLVTAELDTVAIRVPAHPVAQALIRAFGGPLAAPSANPSGRVSPTRAEHVAQGLSGRIAAILDGGPCAVGVESTILGLAGEAKLLRPGGVAMEEIEARIGPVALHQPGEALTAPGQLASHYAPAAALSLNGGTRAECGASWLWSRCGRHCTRHAEPVTRRQSDRGGGQSVSHAARGGPACRAQGPHHCRPDPRSRDWPGDQ